MKTFFQVRLAKDWKIVPEQTKCSGELSKPGSIFVQGKTSQKSILTVNSCDDLNFIEHVQAHVTLMASRRGEVQMTLTSPKGTKSLLIAKRPKDYSRAGFQDWPFLTVCQDFIIHYSLFIIPLSNQVHMWEESPIGDWTLEVINDGRTMVELKHWSISFFGTKDHPQPKLKAE